MRLIAEISQIGIRNVKVQMDLYTPQIVEGDLAADEDPSVPAHRQIITSDRRGAQAA
jgi:hydroxypyruvate isomerase